MPDSPQNQHALPRSHVVEVISRATADALRELRAAGIPETEALAVIKRFSAFAVQVLREMDLVYREFEELLANDPDRSQAHQEWLDTKAGGMLLTLEAMIAALVAEAINKAKEDYRDELSRPREVITMPPPGLTIWDEVRENSKRLFLHPLVLWLVGLPVWYLLWQLVTGSTLWAGGAIALTAVVVGVFKQTGLLVILTAGVLTLLLVLLSDVGVI